MLVKITTSFIVESKTDDLMQTYAEFVDKALAGGLRPVGHTDVRVHNPKVKKAKKK